MKQLIREGLDRFDARDLSGALEVFEQAAQASPAHPVPRFFSGLALFALGDLARARERAVEGLRMSGGNALGHNILALISLRENKPHEAFDALGKHPMAEHPRVQALFLAEIEKHFLRGGA